MKRIRSACTLAALLVAVGEATAQAPGPGDFAWRAALTVPPGASVARVSLPAGALVQLQSADARDLRVFNAAGETVPFARMPAPAPQAAASLSTRSYPALPFNTPAANARRPQGAVQVRIDDTAGGRSVWVQLDGGASAAAATGQSTALFATRGEQQLLKGLTLQATPPPNTPVAVQVSSSADLAQWMRLPVRGRIYRFEGPDAPANDTLEFESPVKLEGRYLRLDWDPQTPLSVTAVAGVTAPAMQAAPRLRAPLTAMRPDGKGALEIDTGFLTPISAIVLSTTTPNTLLPVRILARVEPSQAWRTLANTVVYRLGGGADEGVNPPQPLYGWSGRRLRIESTSKVDLAAQKIEAQAEFEPLQLVFVASGAGPFEIAAGRAATPPAEVALSTITSALGQRKLEDLPEATLGAATQQTLAAPTVLGVPLPAAPGQPALLWAVLVAGVLVLAVVAWSLLRQLKAAAPK